MTLLALASLNQTVQQPGERRLHDAIHDGPLEDEQGMLIHLAVPDHEAEDLLGFYEVRPTGFRSRVRSLQHLADQVLLRSEVAMYQGMVDAGQRCNRGDVEATLAIREWLTLNGHRWPEVATALPS